jgi:bifunctional non-homologous end joining protein LigD
MNVTVTRQRQSRSADRSASLAPRRGAAQQSRRISSMIAPAPIPDLDLSGDVLRLGGKALKVSNLQKVLYREAGFTKGDVIRYYVGVADVMLKHLRGRTVTLKRYPNGSEGMFFYEKNCPVHRPGWVETANIPSRHRENGLDYCLLQNKASLAWVAQLAALELHTSLSKSVAQQRPTMMVFDLDPGPPADILDCITIALRMRDTLARLGLQSFPKTSGGKGLHFYVPLNTPCTYDDTKGFSRAVAELFEQQDPQHVVSAMRKDLRVGKIFIDWSQNDEHKTTCCAYSLRARARPTVSTPVTWQELEQALRARDPSRLVFEARDVLTRVQKRGDLFAPVLTVKQRLPRFG